MPKVHMIEVRKTDITLFMLYKLAMLMNLAHPMPKAKMLWYGLITKRLRITLPSFSAN